MLTLFTYDRAAEVYGVPRSLFEEGVRCRALPAINRGNVVLLREENIDKYLIELETTNPPERVSHLK